MKGIEIKMTDFRITPIEQNGQRVLTTAQLAEAYGTDSKAIKQNFNNNKSRYIEGKHFYCLKNAELKAFKNKVENFDLVGKNAHCLYLWTERGALLHAKSLNTDKAWEVYEFLVDTYFKVQEISSSYAELVKTYNANVEEIINRALDERMDGIIKAVKETVEKTSCETVNTLVPCFDYMHKKLKKLYKKIKK